MRLIIYGKMEVGVGNGRSEEGARCQGKRFGSGIVLVKVKEGSTMATVTNAISNLLMSKERS